MSQRLRRAPIMAFIAVLASSLCALPATAEPTPPPETTATAETTPSTATPAPTGTPASSESPVVSATPIPSETTPTPPPLQPAIGVDQVADFAALAKGARAKNPELGLRLLTSQEDFFKRAIRSTSAAWRAAGIEHDFEELPGPHDYPFNRGPGAIEMLLWHDRVLARAAG